MVIVIDSNVLIGDYHLRGAGFETLRHAAKRTNLRIFVPAPAIEEVTRHFAMELEKHMADVTRGLQGLARIAGGMMDLPGLPAVSIKEVAEEYRATLTFQLGILGATIRDYPSIDHEQVMRRLAERRKPFKDNGSGYADALIWETVIEIIKEHPEEAVYLVTANNKDFGDQSLGGLSPLLVDELRERGLSSERVGTMPSLATYIQADLSQQLEVIQEIIDLMNAGRHRFLPLIREVFSERIGPLTETLGVAATQHFRHLPLTEISVLHLEDTIEDVRVKNARRLSETHVRLEFQGVIWATFDFYVDKSDRWQLDGEETLAYVTISDWNERVDWATADRSLEVLFTAVVDSRQEKIEALDVEQVLRWGNP